MPLHAPNRGPGFRDPAPALRTAWVIWATLLLGVTSFAGVVLVLASRPGRPDAGAASDTLHWVPLGMLGATLAAGWLVRRNLWARVPVALCRRP